MNSRSRPATAAPEIDRRRAFRTTALVAFVWTIAALPFLAGAMRCPTAQLLHFACPGCGMTRAFHLLAGGDVRASLAMHPLAVPTALAQIGLAAATIAATLAFGAPWTLLRARWGRAAVGVAAFVMVADLVLWIARIFGALGGPVAV